MIRPLQNCGADRGADVDKQVSPYDRAAQGTQSVSKCLLDFQRGKRTAEEHRELVASNAGDQYRISESPLQPDCDLPQTFISGSMAKPIVDLFEVVEIDERKSCNRDVVECVLAELMVALFEYAAIGQACQRIALGELPQAIPKLPFISDILLGAEKANGPSMLKRDIGRQTHPSVSPRRV